MKNVELSTEEIQALIQIIDLAIKSSGLGSAEAGVVLAKKLSAHLNEPQQGEPEESDFEVVGPEE
jgi:thiamine biosynthesis lipoprotein ApbE